MVRSSLCSSEEGSTEIILDEDFLASSSEFNEDQICGMSARNSDDIKEDQLKVFEEIEIEEDEEDEDLEDDSIDKDVTIDEYIEDDFRNGFDFFRFLNLVKFEFKLTFKNQTTENEAKQVRVYQTFVSRIRIESIGHWTEKIDQSKFSNKPNRTFNKISFISFLSFLPSYWLITAFLPITPTHLTTNQNSFLAVPESTPHVEEASTPTQNEAVKNRPIKIKNVKVTWDVINVELDSNLDFDLRLGIRRRRKSDLGTVQKWATFSKTGESNVAIPFHAYAGYDYEIVNANSQVQFTFNPSEEDLVEALWKDEDDQDIIKQAKKLISDGKKFDSSEKKIDDVYKLAEVSRLIRCFLSPTDWLRK